MFIDVHCHLNYEEYGDIAQLIARCRDAAVDRIITVGFDLPSSRMAAEIADRFEGVYFTAGLHPTELDKNFESGLKAIEELCAHEKCVALGEIGLDYHYPDTDKQLQYSAFTAQLRLADRLKLPVQIHSRDCAEDMLDVLKAHSHLLNNGALMHCYSHSTELAEEFMKLGMHFSFGGASTWKSNKKAARTLAMLPADRILTETDSPYMAPQSVYRSFPNTPLAIPEICGYIAHIKGVTVETMAETVADNAKKLFHKLG